MQARFCISYSFIVVKFIFFQSSCFDFNLRKSDHYYINFKLRLVNKREKWAP